MPDHDYLPCGCPADYHLADCPHRTGSYGPATKDEWLDLMSSPFYDPDLGFGDDG